MTEKLNLVEAVRHTLGRELDRDGDVIVYGEDVGVNGGVFRATQGLIEEHPDQVYDTPLAEAAIVGLGVGLAASGFRPVPEIQFQGFVYEAFNQLAHHVGRMRSRSRGTVPSRMTLRTPYGAGIRALEHHSESFEAGFANVGGLKVAVPATPSDAKGLLSTAIRGEDPVVFMEPTRIYRAFREDVPEGDHTVPLGEARVVREGDDVTAVAWGGMVREVERAAERADASVEVIDLRTVFPLDSDAIAESVRKTGRCVVAHEAHRTAGMGAEVAARLAEDAFLYLEAPVERVTGYDVPVPMFAREEDYLPGEDRIRRAVERAASY